MGDWQAFIIVSKAVKQYYSIKLAFLFTVTVFNT